jgi:hypothetical protein
VVTNPLGPGQSHAVEPREQLKGASPGGLEYASDAVGGTRNPHALAVEEMFEGVFQPYAFTRSDHSEEARKDPSAGAKNQEEANARKRKESESESGMHYQAA